MNSIFDSIEDILEMTKNKEDWDNDTIVKAFREKENLLLKKIYNFYFRSITQSFIQQNSGLDDSEIVDIYTESFMVIFQKSREPDFKFKVSFQSLLSTICKFQFLNAVRKKKNFGKITKAVQTVHYAEVDVQKEIELVDELNLVMGYIEQLDQPCQTMIKSFYLEEMSLDSIADLLGYKNPKSAKVKRFKCLKKLIDMIVSDNPEFLRNKKEKNEERTTN